MCGTEIDARRALEEVIRLAGSEGRGWWVLNTIPLRDTSNSDADVVIGIPNVGLLILEVKGWTRFTVDEEGRWSRPGIGGQSVDMRDGPFAQAQRQEYLMLHLLDRCRTEGSLNRGDLPRIGSGVLFGNLTAGEVDSSEWVNDLRFTLFRNTFCPAVSPSEQESVEVLKRLRAMLSANMKPTRSTDNGVTRLDEIRRLLAPTRRVHGLAAFVIDAHDGLNRLAETAMTSIADVLTGKSLYVEGAAGTGKTVLALRLGLQRSQLTNRPSLYICYSPLLAEEIRTVRQDDGGSVLIFTPEELLSHVAGPASIEPFHEAESAAAAAALEIAEMMGSNADTEPNQPRSYLGSEVFWDRLVTAVADVGHEFAAVLVDEAQDLWEPAFKYLSALAGHDSLFAVFVDPNQTTRRERAGLTWTRPKATSTGSVLHLRRNFRNGDRIIDAIEECFKIGYERQPRGPLPAELILLPYNNADPLTDVVIRHESELRAAGLDPVVLVTGLNKEQWATLEAHQIAVHSVDSFKGLERKAVILALGRHHSPIDPNDEDLYVGMTRATVLLTIVHHSSHSPLTLDGK